MRHTNITIPDEVLECNRLLAWKKREPTYFTTHVSRRHGYSGEGYKELERGRQFYERVLVGSLVASVGMQNNKSTEWPKGDTTDLDTVFPIKAFWLCFSA